jgi:MFS family permease
MGGVMFLSPESVMPKMAHTLQASDSVILLMPFTIMISIYFMGIFVLPWIERLVTFKRYVITCGFFQRVPYLITGLVLVFTEMSSDKLLWFVVLTPILSGMIGGLGVNAWLEMVTRMLPENLRASGWAYRYIIQALIGLVAGGLIQYILKCNEGEEQLAKGYGYLHLIVFSFLMLSLFSQMLMTEKDMHKLHEPYHATENYWDYLKNLPLMFWKEKNLIIMILVKLTGLGYLMTVSFLTIYALEVTHRPESDEGGFVSMQAVGTVLGSLFAAYIGYRSGGRMVLLISRVLCLIYLGWSCWTESYYGFFFSFFLFGFGLYSDRVGDLTLATELCPKKRRAVYQGMLGFINIFSCLAVIGLSGWFWQYGVSEWKWEQGTAFYYLCGIAGLMSMISCYLICLLPEPRKSMLIVNQQSL